MPFVAAVLFGVLSSGRFVRINCRIFLFCVWLSRCSQTYGNARACLSDAPARCCKVGRFNWSALLAEFSYGVVTCIWFDFTCGWVSKSWRGEFLFLDLCVQQGEAVCLSAAFRKSDDATIQSFSFSLNSSEQTEQCRMERAIKTQQSP